MTTSNKRDVTRALVIINTLRNVYDGSGTDDNFGELIQLLRDVDARTGRRDPSVRKAPKKTARKARR